MNYLQTKHFKIRSASDVKSNAPVPSDDPAKHIWIPEFMTSDRILTPDKAPRYTSTGLEIDVSANDITNRIEIDNSSDVNPGLEALWTEEYKRRTTHNPSLPEIPTPEELLPLEILNFIFLYSPLPHQAANSVHPTRSELDLLEQWKALQNQVIQPERGLEGRKSSDFVTEWLNSSQPGEEEEAGDSQPSFASIPLEPLACGTQKGVDEVGSQRPSSLQSTQVALSEAGLGELQRLASATEEADAWILSVADDSNVPWGFLKSTSEWSSHILDETMRVDMRRDKSWAGSQTNPRGLMIVNNDSRTPVLKPPLFGSQDLLDSQLSIGTSYSSTHVVAAESEALDEATLVSNATRSAISYVCGELTQEERGRPSRLPTDHLLDDLIDESVMTEFANSSSETLDVKADLVGEQSPIPAEFWASFEEEVDEADFINHPAGESSRVLTRIDECEESPELIETPEHSRSDPSTGQTTGAIHSTPAVLRAQSGSANDFQSDQSAILFDAWSSFDQDEIFDEDQIQKNNIPQLDGTDDHEPADEKNKESCHPTQYRGRRRRLGLRLGSSSQLKLNHMKSPDCTLKRVNSSLTEKSMCSSTSLNSCNSTEPPSLPPHIQAVKSAVDSTTHQSAIHKRMGVSMRGRSSLVEKAQTRRTGTSQSEDGSGSPFLKEAVVVLERLPERPDPVADSANSRITNTSYPERLSPVEEFEDIESTGQSKNTFEAFDPKNFSFLQSTQANPDITFDSDTTPGRLSLFSQTQYNPPLPSPPRLLSPLPVKTKLPSSLNWLPLWRPRIPPPSLASVIQWLEAETGEKDAPNQPGNLDQSLSSGYSTSAGSTPNSKEKSSTEINLSKTIESKKPLGLKVPPTCPVIPTIERLCSTSVEQESIVSKQPSSVGSMSLLYRAASQRCFFSMQTDYTTIASLELHCRSRLTSFKARSNAESLVSNAVRSGVLQGGTTTSSNYGLIPDPALDPIAVACLSIRRPLRPTDHPTEAYLPTSKSPVETFVLVNRTQLPCGTGYSTDSIYRLGLTTYDHHFPGTVDPDKTPKESNKSAKGKNHHTCRLTAPCFIWCTDEWSLYSWIVYLTQRFDPDILVGYDVERQSWGYLVERALPVGRRCFLREISRLAPDITNCPCCRQLIAYCGKLTARQHFDECTLSEVDRSICSCPCGLRESADPKSSASSVYHTLGWPAGPGAARTGGLFPCPGRVVLCLWRVLMPEISLFEYSVETVALRLLKETVPHFSYGQLSQWFGGATGIDRDTSECEMQRDSQCCSERGKHRSIFETDPNWKSAPYRVESLLCRMAHRANFLLASPSVTQRARQRAPEAIPLNLEPDSRLYVDGPVAVLDFQSLYPSIVIAYNYCYSTCLGRLSHLTRGEDHVFDLGCLSHSIPAGLISSLKSDVTISPNGVVFVNRSVREGILPRMLKQLLRTRLMVKDSMKFYKDDKALTRLLDARQLGIKLMANVTFGYTAASFSGRMPCVELGDSIVHKARETLERAIELVDSGLLELPPSCSGLAKPRVIYGDTDSLFIHFPGFGKKEAFEAAYAIADAITSRNPAPIKLKMEKIYYPCLLEAKKKYVGYCYETPSQSEPTFDAKGIETVRRDSCPFVGKLLQTTIQVLFDEFHLPPSVESNSKSSHRHADPAGYSQLEREIRRAEEQVRIVVHQFAASLMRGEIPFNDCILTRPYWGQASYKPGTFAPALQIARRLLSLDPRGEPAVGERVVYYVAPGRPDQTLISCIRSIPEIYPPVSQLAAGRSRRAMAPRLNLAYYLDKQLIPPLTRMADLLGWHVYQWLSDLPRYQTVQGHRYMIRSTTSGSGMSSNIPPPSSLCRLGSLGSPSSSLSQSPSWSNLPSDRPRPHRRQSSMMRAFVGKPPRICPSCETVVPAIASADAFGNCVPCTERNPQLCTIGAVRFGLELCDVTQALTTVESLCTGCLKNRGGTCDAVWLCCNIYCPAHSERLLAASSMARFWINHVNHLSSLDASW
ncbi:unnamed protein product [Calicophoron daubneyi]|uniref:DNA polymerase n=1 Tax=Calicophoron daubneyi TaxID=300641 RepID=A0AAV2TBH6_CALDB